ncbi:MULTISPECIES: hypothetical protein [Brevibacillus]|uniref:hypothetical protein n=1 Tax=Brevibacillus TaxID=55080 RepID=UPI001C8DCE78|nr:MULTISPECIES: hypothetical protein [Brevibacillus]MBY0088259.1 hypothetical protein [Brevibacillus brevis]MCM3141619.1 hypothetical protein [Brevibacillus sp. MER 51]
MKKKKVNSKKFKKVNGQLVQYSSYYPAQAGGCIWICMRHGCGWWCPEREM